MTSRPPTGVPPRPPQRGLSSAALAVQRSSHHQRVRSRQYLPASASPLRNDAHADAPSQPVDAAQARLHASSNPRRGHSKLRLELSSELDSETPPAAELPQIPTPVRAVPAPVQPGSVSVPVADAADADKTSPTLSRGPQQDADSNPPLPMPKRPPRPDQRSESPPPRPPAASSAAPRRDARPRPYMVEVPPASPRFVTSRRHEIPAKDPFSKGLFTTHADFHPWSGHHHEDEWSPEAIQKGTWDRGSQNETATARMAITPALKQKSGLNALSTIFMGIINQRRYRGQITAPSTFKPPPRVTLTDTKREVWLRDLANPAISLRRLSRTIPHGIRGRTLLDQCLNKRVPTERALWLAKCVGANEIRAFKRKGAGGAFVIGGESKWVRDWTIFVEQFVESIALAFEEPDWKAKVTYAVRLSTNLYNEHLLDRDHYLDWVTSGLENSTQSRMPMWIVLAKITWADILRSRKFARRLVYTMLAQLHAIHKEPDRDILIQLSSELCNLLKTLLTTNPESFVCPSLWPKYRAALNTFLPADDAQSQAALHRVDMRNARLLVANTASPSTGRQHLVKLLDSTIQGKGDRDLAAKCWAAVDSKPEIVKSVVEWATSLHRPGLVRTYVAVRLIKTWSKSNINATSAIVDILGDGRPQHRLRSKSVFHLVAELVRSGLFSVPQYMQWLIGRGGLHGADEIDPDSGPCASRLLVELPVHCLSDSQKAQRSSLLRRTGQYSTADEANDIANALRCVDDCLGLARHLGRAEPQPKRCLPLRKLLRRVSDSSKAVQTSIGVHLRGVFTPDLLGRVDAATALPMFTSARAVLESAGDFAMLAHVLKAWSASSNIPVLAASVDTVNAHLEIFLALGCADGLFDAIIGRLKSINRLQRVVARPLLAALASLARRLPHREAIAKQLVRELAQSDRSSAIDACSPVSDNMAMQAPSAEGEVSDQIDKLLASGNTVDPPLMNRLFRNIIPKLEAGWAKADDSRRVFASLLARLRVFDTQHFDKLMADWASHVGALKDRPKLSELFPLLAILGCLSISTMLHSAGAAPPPAEEAPPSYPGSPPSGSEVYQQELLRLVIMKLPRTAPLDCGEAYRFEIQQKVARLQHPKALLQLIRNALVEYGALRTRAPERDCLLDDAACKERLVETLQYLVVADSDAVTNVLSVGSLRPGAIALVRQLITRLLKPDGDGESQTSFDQILSLADELTMPFCQLKLNLDLSCEFQSDAGGEGAGEGADAGEDGRPSRFEAFAKAMDRAIEARHIVWTSMLPCLSQDIMQHLSTQAHARFLGLMPSPKSASFVEDATSEHRIYLAKNLLGVVEAIISGQPPSKSAQLTAGLADKLSDLWEIAASKDEDRARARQEVLGHWLPALLRFVNLHGTWAEPAPAPNPGQPPAPSAAKAAAPPANHETRARLVLLLCGLFLELESRAPTAQGALSRQVFDVAVLLVDALPDEARAQCAKFVLFVPGVPPSTSTSADPRLYYLFSTAPPTWAEDLRLAFRDRASIAYSAAARGMSAMYGIGPAAHERLAPFALRRWEVLSEPTPNVGVNDTSLSLGLFEAIKIP